MKVLEVLQILKAVKEQKEIFDKEYQKIVDNQDDYSINYYHQVSISRRRWGKIAEMVQMEIDVLIGVVGLR